MELSVIILNFNASVFLELCVESCLRATSNLNAEIIVIDNDSSDDSMDRLCKRYPQVKTIRLDNNYGFSKGNNIAVAQAQGTHICLINPDVVVGEKVLENGLAFAKANSNSGFIGVRLIDGTGKFLPESKRRIPKPWSALKKLIDLPSGYYDSRIDMEEDNSTEVLVGAFMLGEKKLYDELGGFDERYFMYGEDIDLSYTALKAGFTNYFLGSQSCIHFKGESTVKDSNYKERFYGAMGLFYQKHHPAGKFLGAFLKWFLPKFSKSSINSTFINSTQQRDIVVVTNDREFSMRQAYKTLVWNDLENLSLHNQHFIWDISTLKIENIINFMWVERHKKHTYRFLNQKRDAVAGSDSRDYPGEVRKF